MALLSVLLLVMVVSVVAIGVLDDIRFGLRRTSNAETTGQAQWYALGAEALAKARLQQTLGAVGRVGASGPWDKRALIFPIDNGRITARIADLGSCFNLNSVVVGPVDFPIASSEGTGQLASLIEGVGTPSNRALRLASALSDWIDADNNTGRLGAEDEAYARKSPPYRTAGTLLAEVSELRAVSGFTPEIYAKLRPYVCALPRTGPSEININTLTAEQAPILRALYHGKLSDEAAHRAIAGRPSTGWPNEGAFLDQAALADAARAGVQPPLLQIATDSRYFGVDVAVEFGEARVSMSGLLERDASGAVRSVARRWTPDD